MSKKQSYQNRGRGFMKLLATTAMMFSHVYDFVFNRNHRNTGKAGGHLDTSYHSGGSRGHSTKVQQSKHKASIEKKRRRKEVQRSQRINHNRKNRVCSFK